MVITSDYGSLVRRSNRRGPATFKQGASTASFLLAKFHGNAFVANYGHFTKADLPWEQLNRVDALKAALAETEA